MTDQADGASRRQPVRSKSVTHVPGTARHLCDRYAPLVECCRKEESNLRPADYEGEKEDGGTEKSSLRLRFCY
jgi:hypothetical protein